MDLGESILVWKIRMEHGNIRSIAKLWGTEKFLVGSKSPKRHILKSEGGRPGKRCRCHQLFRDWLDDAGFITYGPIRDIFLTTGLFHTQRYVLA